MSIAHDFSMENGFSGSSDTPVARRTASNAHCIASPTRVAGKASRLRSVARRLNKSAEQVRRLEEPTSDMLVSELYQWQQALEVPIVDLLVDCDAPLSEPVLTRARLLKIMKTVRAIKEVDQVCLDRTHGQHARAAIDRSHAGAEGRLRLALGRPATLARRTRAHGRTSDSRFVFHGRFRLLRAGKTAPRACGLESHQGTA